VQDLRDAQVDGLPIDDNDIEGQAASIANSDEIWNARYVPPPPLPFSVLTSTSPEDDLDNAYVLKAGR
jgi:hypothetical protein